MLGDPEREFEIAQFGVGRRALGRDLDIHVLNDGIVAALHQQATGNRLGGQASRARIRQAAREQQPQILPAADYRDRFFGGVGRDDHFGEDADDGARGFRIERAVDRDDAAIGGGRVAGERAAIGCDEIKSLRNAAGVRMFDDDACRCALRIKFADALIGGIGIVDVVVGQLLALQLPRGGDAGPLVGRTIERGRLVRVLAITQGLD